MLAIFKFCGELLTKIVSYWQSVSIGGFRPFWYLIGIALLTLFGAFIRGLLFSGIGGSSASKIAGKMNKGGKKDGSKVIIIKK
ncbi:MAG: hypothetical protein MRERV_14c038 [Mycoplasmataceae bacterium RV_VA103A]|nr:MAG: hypothetical protein MRERV_14c038 [Mycoplasmataceae bacterium RV_VA103A]